MPIIQPVFLFKYRLILTFAIILLSACSQQGGIRPQSTPDSADLAYEVQQERLREINAWRLRARIAIRTVNDSNTGSLRWQQKTQGLGLRLLGPLGITVAKIEGKSGQYSLQDRQGNLWQSDSINQLIYSRTGWALPVEQLRYWILADTQNSGDADFVSNADGTLASLQFEEWHISYEEYMWVGDIQLPAKIRITHPDINIKLSMRKWTLGDD